MIEKVNYRIQQNRKIMQQVEVKNGQLKEQLQEQQKFYEEFKPQKLIFNQKIEELRKQIEQSQDGKNQFKDNDLALTQLQQSINVLKSQKQQFILNNQIIQMYEILTGLKVSPNAQNIQQFNQYQAQVVNAINDVNIQQNSFVFSIGDPSNKRNYGGVIKQQEDGNININYLRRSENEDFNQEFTLDRDSVKVLIDQMIAQLLE